MRNLHFFATLFVIIINLSLSRVSLSDPQNNLEPQSSLANYETFMHRIQADQVPDSPCWVIDLEALENNLCILRDVQDFSGCKILLALKGFAAYSTFPLIKSYLAGAASSSPHEARLAKEEMGGEVHAYAPAYSDNDMTQMVNLCDHLVFNSFSQWERFKSQALAHNISGGIRVNPEHSEVTVALYDPCAPQSRLGVTQAHFQENLLEGLEGIHFHTLCELGSDALERTLKEVEKKFGRYFKRLKWINMGGGHHITKSHYDRERLVRVIKDFRERTGLDVYLEPGEAVVIGTGVLVATVLDIIDNNGPIAILDTSATAHMPDTLEMPYRPDIVGAGLPHEKDHTYRLGGITCLAGDVIGDYSFDEPLSVGQRLVFLDMSHYTMVKTTSFNGVRLPSLVLRTKDGSYQLIKSYGYEVYKDRL